MRVPSNCGDTADGFSPGDPAFVANAGRILDIYQRVWKDKSLNEDEFVFSAHKKTSIQAPAWRHATCSLQPGSSIKVEHVVRDAAHEPVLLQSMFTGKTPCNLA